MRLAVLKIGVLLVFLAVGATLGAQAAGNQGWMASGIYLGGRGQYRFPQSTVSTTGYTYGFDGLPLYAAATGNRFDTPILGNALGYGAGFGFVQCERPRTLAVILSADWSMSTGSASSSVGILDCVSHEVDLVAEGLYPLGAGFAISAQIGWSMDFFSIANGLLPNGGSRENLLLSFVGLDMGAGAAYLIDRRLLLQAKYVFRFIGYNLASGSGVADSLGTEIARQEGALEFTMGWILGPK
jgi:hypothetical protein